jgi:hypothetical protein
MKATMATRAQPVWRLLGAGLCGLTAWSLAWAPLVRTHAQTVTQGTTPTPRPPEAGVRVVPLKAQSFSSLQTATAGTGASTALRQTFVNTVQVRAEDASGQEVSASASATVELLRMDLSCALAATGRSAAGLTNGCLWLLGEGIYAVQFVLTVTNTGAVDVTNVTVSSPALEAMGGGFPALAWLPTHSSLSVTSSVLYVCNQPREDLFRVEVRGEPDRLGTGLCSLDLSGRLITAASDCGTCIRCEVQPSLRTVQAMRFNPQTGLFDMIVEVRNPTPFPFPAVRVLTFDLPADVTLWNASGATNGVPYVQYNAVVPPGGSTQMILEFYRPNRILPEPVLVPAIVSSLPPPPNPVGAFQRITRAARLVDGTFLIEWDSATNRLYYVQYTGDLVTWRTVIPGLAGTGTKMQWIDNGPPKTDTPPHDTPYRFLRVVGVQ